MTSWHRSKGVERFSCSIRTFCCGRWTPLSACHRMSWSRLNHPNPRFMSAPPVFGRLRSGRPWGRSIFIIRHRRSRRRRGRPASPICPSAPRMLPRLRNCRCTTVTRLTACWLHKPCSCRRNCSPPIRHSCPIRNWCGWSEQVILIKR